MVLQKRQKSRIAEHNYEFLLLVFQNLGNLECGFEGLNKEQGDSFLTACG